MGGNIGNVEGLINFAYMLYKGGYCNYIEGVEDGDPVIDINLRVMFCDMSRRSSYSRQNISRLEQAYNVSLFCDDKYSRFWFWETTDINYQLSNITCGGCSYHGQNDEGCGVCPYNLSGCVQYVYKEKEKIEAIFRKMLGQRLISFEAPKVIGSIQKPIVNNEDIVSLFRNNSPGTQERLVEECANVLNKINYKSAYGAMTLIFMKVINLSMTGDINYRYLNLCDYSQKGEVVHKIINFWKNEGGISCSHMDIQSLFKSLDEKDGCSRCEYEQCPHKAAATIMLAAKLTRQNPVDMAYTIYLRNKYPGLSEQDSLQFDYFKGRNEKLPLSPESQQTFNQMIMYITGRRVNRRAPFINLGMHVFSSDAELTERFIDLFHNVIWSFSYFNGGLQGRENIYLSSTPLSEVISKIQQMSDGRYVVFYYPEQIEKMDEFNAYYFDFLRLLESRKNGIIPIFVGEKYGVEKFFESHSELKKKYVPRCIEIQEMNKNSIKEQACDKIEEALMVEPKEKEILFRYIDSEYPQSKLKSVDFINNLYEQVVFKHYSDLNIDNNANENQMDKLRATDIPEYKEPRSEEEIFAELNRLTGLENVKSKLHEISNLVKFDIKKSKQVQGQVSSSRMNMHMVFGGNAGTGKTTVARLTAEILYSIGFIQENKLVCVSAKELVGEYLGQTAPKTAKKCEEAYNGVLFIDEAYQLNPGDRGDIFKEECIAELIQQMENNRDKLVVIFAGYTEEMNDFIQHANTGLSSRIGYRIDFPDYSTKELVKIFHSISKSEGMILGEGVDERLYMIFDEARKDASKFGNARFARSVFEKSKLKHATNAAYYTEKDPRLLLINSNEIEA